MAPRNTIHIPPGAAKILLEAQDVCAEAVEADDEEELESYQSALEVDDAEDEACEYVLMSASGHVLRLTEGSSS